MALTSSDVVGICRCWFTTAHMDGPGAARQSTAALALAVVRHCVSARTPHRSSGSRAVVVCSGHGCPRVPLSWRRRRRGDFNLQESDPARLAAQRRQVEQDQVARWRQSVEREIYELERIRELRRLKQRKAPESYVQREAEREIELRSLAHLLSRGLDEKKSRVFKSRVLLGVRCHGKGHFLARVYVTPHLPILVPQNAGLPPAESKDRRFADLEKMKRLRSIFPMVKFRDTWIEEYPDEDLVRHLIERERRRFGQEVSDARLREIELEATEFFLRGLTLIEPHHRQREVVMDGVSVEPSWYLWCRCGSRVLACHRVAQALGDGVRQIFA